jgi:hypothetical protein
VPPTPTVPPEDEDLRWSRVTGQVTALTRTLAVTVDEHRTPAPPEGAVLRLYARLLELIGDACHGEADRLAGTAGEDRPGRADPAVLEDLHERLQEGLREHAGRGAAPTVVLGSLLLQAENIWAEILPPDDSVEASDADHPVSGRSAEHREVPLR